MFQLYGPFGLVSNPLQERIRGHFGELFGAIWRCFGLPKTLIPYSTSLKNRVWSVPVSELYSDSPSEASQSVCKRLLKRAWDPFWVPFGDFDGRTSVGNSIFLGLWHCSSELGLSDGRQGCFYKAFGPLFESSGLLLEGIWSHFWVFRAAFLSYFPCVPYSLYLFRRFCLLAQVWPEQLWKLSGHILFLAAPKLK